MAVYCRVASSSATKRKEYKQTEKPLLPVSLEATHVGSAGLAGRTRPLARHAPAGACHQQGASRRLLLDHPLVVAILALQPPVCPRPLGFEAPPPLHAHEAECFVRQSPSIGSRWWLGNVPVEIEPYIGILLYRTCRSRGLSLIHI